MQEWRTVNFAARHSDETRAWANGRIVVKRTPASFTNTHIAPEDAVTVQLNALGVGSIRLWCNDEGQIPSSYHMTLPDKKTCFCFVLPRSAPDPVGIWTLIAAGITEQMPNYQTILDYINGLGGVGGGNAPVVFQQNTASTTWTFNHTLNRVPQVTVTDLAGNNLFVEVQATLTQIFVRSTVPYTGIVYAQ